MTGNKPTNQKSDMINAAVFGAGRIGKVHTHNIAGLPGVALRYVVDVNPVAASELGVDPTVVSPAAISITAAPAERSCQGRTAHTGSRAPISAGVSAA